VNKPSKAKVVSLIVGKNTEKALELLASTYGMKPPSLRVGLPKSKSHVLACYVVEKHTIYFANRESFFNPFVVLHEFYHALRARSGKHRGTEKKAHEFAEEYILKYIQSLEGTA
jgi:hypothetical protein